MKTITKQGHSYLRIIGIVIILAGIGLVAFYTFKQNEEAASLPGVEGEIACIPLKSGDKVDEATCMKGLKSPKGMYLAIESVPQEELKLGEKRTVEGNLKPLSAENESKYMIVGTIVAK